ncbi:MAG: SDR family oxidoreductase [Haliscomenobacter sp.]|nr:SDR family oxidoreductase [Haliscomenobacter sp.]
MKNSIAWKVAVRCVEEGAAITLTNAPVHAFWRNPETGRNHGRRGHSCGCTSEKISKTCSSNRWLSWVAPGFCPALYRHVGQCAQKKDYTDLNYEWMLKTFDVSSISFHKMMQTLWKLDAMQEWGSILALSYIAAQRTFPDYSEMAESKALLESFGRSFGYHYGTAKKVRVNTLSQSPTRTTAGSGVKGFDEFFTYADKMSPLGNASAEACADYCVTLFPISPGR